MSVPGHARNPGQPLPALSGRHKRLLAVLVREYVEHGEPVSSLWLAAHSGLGLSSATVRNMLASLETDGFVHQPHTSAGRVPTDLGYRMFVDMLLESRRRARLTPEVEARLRRAGTVDEVLDDVTHELSRASTHLGFALTPASGGASLRHIEFVSLGGTKVLVVVVSASGQVTHKLVETEEALSGIELGEAANYLNREFSGLPLTDIRTRIMERMREDRTLYDVLRTRALRLAESSLGTMADGATLYVHGASTLLEDGPDDVRPSIEAMRTLLQMIEDKHRLVKLLTHYIEGTGLTIVIGTEHTAPDLHRFSLVASTYSDGTATGTVGVIGPTRMRYSKTIAVVDSLSQAVTKVLLDHSH